METIIRYVYLYSISKGTVSCYRQYIDQYTAKEHKTWEKAMSYEEARKTYDHVSMVQ